MADKTPAELAAEALQSLTDAVTPLAKSAVDMVAEAQVAFAQAVDYDKVFAEALAKAATDEAMKKPPMDADGDYDGDTEKPKTQEISKALEALELAGAAHGVVGAYLLGAVDPAVAKAEDSPWAAFFKQAEEYYKTVNATLGKQVVDWRKKSADLRDKMTKADDTTDDGKKAKAEATIEASNADEIADAANGACEVAKGIVEAAVWPRVELRLDPPHAMAKGYMTIATTADLMDAVAKYKTVDIKDQPPVYAHIFNAAAALKTKLPEGWHAPATLEGDKSHSTGTTQTARWKDISEADKKAAMAKGVTVIGPTAGLLSTLRMISASPLIERMKIANPEDKAPDELKDLIGKMDTLLKGIVAAEAESIRILDIPTFPEVVFKADHWATVAAKACVETMTDDMPVERRALRKELGTRLDAAAEVFIKAAGSEDLNKRSAEALEKSQGEVVALKGDLAKFTASLIPLTRSAQAQKDELKKMAAENAVLKAENVKLKAEPMPSKGRVGEAGDLHKSATETTGESSKALLDKVDALPAGADRGRALLAAAHRMRAEEASA